MRTTLLILAIVSLCQLMGFSIVQEELLPASTPFAHASTILETASEDLLVAWYGGHREGSKDNAIYLSKRMKNAETGALTWDQPKVVATGGEVGIDLACWNPVLFQMPSGTILLFYKIGKHPSSWQGYLKRSFNGGETWSLPEKLPEGIIGPAKNKPLLYRDSLLLCGSSRESHEARTVWIDFTSDEGRHWDTIGPLPPTDTWTIQPTFIANPIGKIYLFCRSKTNWIYGADSDDPIKTWSSLTPTSLPSNNSGIDAIGLAGGKVFLIAFNDVVFNSGARNWLRLALSKDQGETWEKDLTIEWSFNPFTYTWKRERIKHVVLSN